MPQLTKAVAGNSQLAEAWMLGFPWTLFGGKWGGGGGGGGGIRDFISACFFPPKLERIWESICKRLILLFHNNCFFFI